jgi:hypothetical protein
VSLFLLPVLSAEGLCLCCNDVSEALFDDDPKILSLALLYSSSLSFIVFFFSLFLSFAFEEYCTFSRRKICGGGGAVTACWYSPEEDEEEGLYRRGLSTVGGKDRFDKSGCG